MSAKTAKEWAASTCAALWLEPQKEASLVKYFAAAMQDARAQALEEAAGIAERLLRKQPENELEGGKIIAASIIADAIRALAAKNGGR